MPTADAGDAEITALGPDHAAWRIIALGYLLGLVTAAGWLVAATGGWLLVGLATVVFGWWLVGIVVQLVTANRVWTIKTGIGKLAYEVFEWLAGLVSFIYFGDGGFEWRPTFERADYVRTELLTED